MKKALPSRPRYTHPAKRSPPKRAGSLALREEAYAPSTGIIPARDFLVRPEGRKGIDVQSDHPRGATPSLGPLAPAGRRSAFGEFQATQLYCPTCGRAMPVKEHLVLYLPSGALYHYRCVRCHATLGKRQT